MFGRITFPVLKDILVKVEVALQEAQKEYDKDISIKINRSNDKGATPTTISSPYRSYRITARKKLAAQIKAIAKEIK